VNKASRLALAHSAQCNNVAGTTTRYEVLTSQPPDVLIRADFVTEDLSEAKGLETFSKLVNIEHIKKILFNLKAVIEASKADGKNPAEILANRCIPANCQFTLDN
jgi:hypothetical protein